MQKQIGLFLVAVIGFTVLLSGPLNAGVGKFGARRHDRGGLARLDLTPEERQKLHAAREKALKDANVAAALDDKKSVDREFRETTRAALLKEDASLGPILDKIKGPGHRHPDRAGSSPSPAPTSDASQIDEDRADNTGGGRFADLSKDEREKLRTAMQKIRNNPDVTAAHERKIKADKAFRDAMHTAMIAADPSIEPLLKKIESEMPQRRRGPIDNT
jgi:hypothetical protein